MELWDVYDADRNKTGKTVVRGNAPGEGEYRLVVHVCIFNRKGEMLIQQRQSFKEGWPNMWDVTLGGGAIAGDSSQTAAERELKEELGLDLSLNGIRPRLTFHFSHGFDDVYLLTEEIDLNSLTLQYEEVQRVKWATREEIERMIASGEFIPYHPSFIQFLFDVRDCPDLRTKKS